MKIVSNYDGDVILDGYARNVWVTYINFYFRKISFLQSCHDVTESNWCKQFENVRKMSRESNWRKWKVSIMNSEQSIILRNWEPCSFLSETDKSECPVMGQCPPLRGWSRPLFAVLALFSLPHSIIANRNFIRYQSVRLLFKWICKINHSCTSTFPWDRSYQFNQKFLFLWISNCVERKKRRNHHC